MSNEGTPWWKKLKPPKIFGRIGSFKANKVDDSNAPIVPVVGMDAPILSVDKNTIQSSSHGDELQSTSSIRPLVSVVSVEVDLPDQENIHANVASDEPDVITDLNTVDINLIKKELEKCHSSGLCLSLPKEKETELCLKTEVKDHAKHVPFGPKRVKIDKEIEKLTQQYHGTVKEETKAASKLDFNETPLDFLNKAANLLQSFPKQEDENFSQYNTFITTSLESIIEKADCSIESLAREAPQHTHVLLTNKNKVKIQRFHSDTGTWKGVWCEPSKLKPVFDEYYDYMQSDNKAAIDAKNNNGLDFEGVSSDFFGVSQPSTCGTEGSPIGFLEKEINFQYSAGSVYCHIQYGPKTLSIGFQLEAVRFNDVTIPASYSATGEQQIVWGQFFKVVDNLQVPLIVKQFIGNLDDMWSDFSFVFSGANETKNNVLDIFRFTPEEKLNSKRNFVHTQSVLKISVLESNSLKSGNSFLACNFFGMKAIKGATSTHPNHRYQPSINSSLNQAIYLYDKLDRKIPPVCIDLAEVHSAGLEMLRKPSITSWLLENSKYWTKARQFSSKGSETPWNSHYKPLEECLIDFFDSKSPNQNEPAFECSSVDERTGLSLTHSQVPTKSRKKMTKGQKKAAQKLKTKTESKHIDWKEKLTPEGIILMDTPILDLENIYHRLSNSEDFKLKLSYLDENSKEMGQMIEQQLEMAILEKGVGATAHQVFDILGGNHKANTERYYDGHKLADLVYAAWTVLIPSDSDVKEEIVDADVDDQNDLPPDSSEEIIVSQEVGALNHLKSLFSREGFDELAKELGPPHDNDQLALRNMQEWISIVEIFNENFSEHTIKYFGEGTLTVELLFNLLFSDWPDIDLPKNKAFINFLKDQVDSKSKAAINIIDKFFDPNIIMDEKVVEKMQNSKFPDYKPELHKTYTNIREDHIKNYSKDNKPSSDTITIRFFTSQGYLMLSPFHMWKKLKRLSSHSKYFENKARSRGAIKRTNEIKNQKNHTKSKCAKESIEDAHFNRVRRGDLIERLFKNKDIDKKEYDRLSFFNREPERLSDSYHNEVTWKGFHDFAFDTDKLVVQLHNSKWPLDKKTYLSQPETIKHYKRYSFKANNITLGDTIKPQRERVVLDLVGLDDPYLMNI